MSSDTGQHLLVGVRGTGRTDAEVHQSVQKGRRGEGEDEDEGEVATRLPGTPFRTGRRKPDRMDPVLSSGVENGLGGEEVDQANWWAWRIALTRG